MLIVPNNESHIKCIHQDDFIGAWDDQIREILLDICVVLLQWHLQLNGSWRKLGICPKCGKIYATEEVR
jgi:hypothetical protein